MNMLKKMLIRTFFQMGGAILSLESQSPGHADAKAAYEFMFAGVNDRVELALAKASLGLADKVRIAGSHDQHITIQVPGADRLPCGVELYARDSAVR